jgi:hypothetical protein
MVYAPAVNWRATVTYFVLLTLQWTRNGRHDIESSSVMRSFDMTILAATHEVQLRSTTSLDQVLAGSNTRCKVLELSYATE